MNLKNSADPGEGGKDNKEEDEFLGLMQEKCILSKANLSMLMCR